MSPLLARAVCVAAVALASCSGPADTADTIGPAGSTGPADPAGSAVLAFRPVLQRGLPCDTEADDGTAVLPMEDEPAACSQLGPAGFDGTSLSRVEAAPSGVEGTQWIIEVEVAEDRQAQANELINTCASQGIDCPTGQMAIVVDDVIVSAPTVTSPNLADEEFVISGDGSDGFTRAEAEDLAERIRG